MRVLQTLALPLGYVTIAVIYINAAFIESSQNFRFDAHTNVWASYGAGYEARTRYLHLGKVALYQMS